MRTSLRLLLIIGVLLSYGVLPVEAARYAHIPMGVYNFSSPDALAQVAEELLGPIWGPVKRIVKSESLVAEFSREGVITLQKFVGPEERIYRLVEFDGKGRETGGILSEDGGPSKFVYDDMQQQLNWELCSRGGMDCVNIAGTTDNKGRIASLSGVIPIRFKYNAAGQVTELVYYWYANNRIEYVYNEKGQLLKKTRFKGPARQKDAEPTFQSAIDFIYDTSGHLVRVNRFDGMKTETADVTGAYDKYGNWLKLLYSPRQAGARAYEVERTIEYY